MKPKIYIETTIPSSYFDIRNDVESVVRRNWTRLCWEEAQKSYQFISSEAVVNELSNGNFPIKNDALKLMGTIPLIEIEIEVFEIVQIYIKNYVMPANPVGDALHLALASYNKCEFLLTWNCKHLANAGKFEHIRKVNTDLGLICPYLVTPLELIDLEII